MNLQVKSGHTRLLTVAGDGLVAGNRVGVPAALLPAESAGLLWPNASDRGRSWPIRLVPLADAPTDVLLLHEELARTTGLSGRNAEDWLIAAEPHRTAASVVLESATDLPPEDCVRQLRTTATLDGHVFRHETDAREETTWLYADDVPYRIRSVADADGHPMTGLLRIGRDTALSLFLPGHRAGIDVVILADCSGSMSWDDVQDTADVGRRFFQRSRYLTRMDALKRALSQMADGRLSVGSRPTKMALVRFTTESQAVFPRAGGMAEIADADTVRELHAAIGLLKPEQAGTDIGQALHYASELLHRYGNPQNDRLIVLVSDGADWAEKGVDATGEMLAATADPVSLLDELRSSLKIRLHAVGVSDESTFWPWWRENHQRTNGEPHISIVPNHRLLARLVEVGGGDPSRIGGMDVLREYFGELGAGVTRTVGSPQHGRLPAPQPEIARVLEAAHVTTAAADRHRGGLADHVQQMYAACVQASRRRIGRPLYRQPNDPQAIQRIGAPVTNRASFNAWILDVHQVFHEQQESQLRESAPKTPYPIPEVRDIVWDGRLGRIHVMRTETAHNAAGHRQAEDHQRAVGEIYLDLTGRYHVADDDADGWSRLQIGLLSGLAGMLDDIYAVLNRPDDPAASSSPAPDGRGATAQGQPVHAFVPQPDGPDLLTQGW